MPDWGTMPWGFGPWGGAPAVPEPVNPPYIIDRVPAPNSTEVNEEAPIFVRFYDIDLNLNPASVQLTINGVLAFSGGVFTSGYVGVYSFTAGVYLVRIFKIGGWGYDSTVTVTGYAEDTTFFPLSVTDTWSWRTRSNPICYSGLTPLAIETAIQSPLVTFLDIEPARRLFLDNALIVDPLRTRAIPNQGNKAARVLYQIGFETEISTVLNTYRLRNAAALKTVVCERNNLLLIDAALMKTHEQLKTGIQSLFSLGALPETYISGFLEYLDSTIPTYRVSIVANMILLAKSKELSV